MKEMNGYNLIRAWYDFKYENPSVCRSIHSDLFCYIINLWNKLGHKNEFGLPTQITMESLGIGSYNTYKKTLDELIGFGVIKLVKESKNQHQSKIIAISIFDKASDKALDKATIKASDEATDTIIKQYNNITIEQISDEVFDLLVNNIDLVNENLKKWIKEENKNKKPLIKKQNERVLLSEVDINTLSEQDQVYFKIAIGFRDLFIKNKKALGVNDFKDQENATYKGYVDPIRLAFTQDKKTEEDFRKVYAFLMKDEFWMKNIMSARTLREKMSDLLLRCSSLPKKKLKLPQGYFNMKLNNEQRKLLPEDELKRYERNMIKLEMDGGFIKQAPIEYED
jgi:hypothetical protein